MYQEIPLFSHEFQCFEKYVLVKPTVVDAEEKSESGIVIKTNRTLIENRPGCGKVIVSGDTEKVKADDYVVFPQTDGIDCKFKDGDFLLLKIESIIGKKV